jgi:putative ABC transport system permease protein
MFKSNFKSAVRNLVKNKIYTTINMFGLSVGLGATLLIILLIQYELSYDRYNEHADRIYRVLIKEPSDEKGLSLSEYQLFKNELMENPAIYKIGAANGDISFIYHENKYLDGSDTKYYLYGKNPETALQFLEFYSTPDFLKVLDIPVISGRNFMNPLSSEIHEAVVINESAEKLFGETFIINRKIGTPPGIFKHEGFVVGVCRDFYLKSLHHALEPMVIHHMDYFPGDVHRMVSNIFIRYGEENFSAAFRHIQSVWNDFFPDTPFQYTFFEEEINLHYEEENQLIQIFITFAILSILISCLGLFGLISYSTEQRTKEIGIRKVLGASVSNITFMLTQDFTKLVLLASIIAWPLVYFVIHQWLQNFAYRIDITFWPFLLAGLAALVIAWLTISWQAIRAATANPVESLRYE